MCGSASLRWETRPREKKRRDIGDLRTMGGELVRMVRPSSQKSYSSKGQRGKRLSVCKHKRVELSCPFWFARHKSCDQISRTLVDQPHFQTISASALGNVTRTPLDSASTMQFALHEMCTTFLSFSSLKMHFDTQQCIGGDSV